MKRREKKKKTHQQQISPSRLTRVIPTGWESLETSNDTTKRYFLVSGSCCKHHPHASIYIYIYIKKIINANFKFFLRVFWSFQYVFEMRKDLFAPQLNLLMNNTPCKKILILSITSFKIFGVKSKITIILFMWILFFSEWVIFFSKCFSFGYWLFEKKK